MIADLALLLATLSIMTGALVITGVPTKLGSLLVEAAGVNLAAMVLMSFIFGAILGTGLPPAPTYILVAIVIAPPMIQAGVNPWVVHFFAFFLGVFGELTPPTSLVAAITAKIANASFYATLNRALQICVSLFTLMAGVFVRPELVIEPGLGQMARRGADPDPDNRTHLQHAGPFCRPPAVDLPSAWGSRRSRLSPCCTRTKGGDSGASAGVSAHRLLAAAPSRRPARRGGHGGTPALASSFAGPNPAGAGS